MRLRLPSTLIRWALSSKTHRFKNAIESDVDQNQNAYRISVEGRKRIRMNTKTENIAGACVYSVRIESNLRHNV